MDRARWVESLERELAAAESRHPRNERRIDEIKAHLSQFADEPAEARIEVPEQKAKAAPRKRAPRKA